MSELIKREDAIKATWHDPSYIDPYNILTEVRDRIEALPTVDAVQVVRCGQCKCGSKWSMDMIQCEVYGILHSADWFCADGERKDGERRTDGK